MSQATNFSPPAASAPPTTGTIHDLPPHRMHGRFLNAISLVVGAGFTTCLFLSIAIFLHTQKQAAPRVPDDLETVAVAMPPPPPPPRAEEKRPVAAEAPDAIALGFEEEAAVSPVKIAPSPPSYDELLPMSRIPSHVVSGGIGIDTSLKPRMDVSFDGDHVYQRSEVDKRPYVISRPEPVVPAHIQSQTDELNVVVLFVVDAHGVVGNLHILRSSNNPEFDSIIADNIREWAFSPAIKQGRPVRCMVQQMVTVQWRTSWDHFSVH